MNLNNLTIKSQEVLQQAQQLAHDLGHQQIENEHIFKAILMVDENVTPFILKKLGVNVDLFTQVLDKTLRSEEHTSELQSRGHLVCRLLLEKKNINIRNCI